MTHNTVGNYRRHLSEKGIELLSFDFRNAQHKCLSCGNEWTARPAMMLRNNTGCKVCYKNEKQKEKNFQLEIAHRKICQKKNLFLLEPYKGKAALHLHRCLDCNHEFKIKLSDVDKAKHGCCPECKRTSTPHFDRTPNSVHKKKIEELGKVKVLSFVKEDKDRVKVRCVTCESAFVANKRYLSSAAFNCPVCKFQKKAKRNRCNKGYMLNDNAITVQGYEHFALDYLLKKGVDPLDIHAGLNNTNIPIVNYQHKARWHRYFPDIYVKSMNRVVEVKSIYTLGVKRPRVFYRVRMKAKAAIAEGYDFKLLCFSSSGNIYKMPPEWYDLSHAKFRLAFNRLNSIADEN